MDHAPSAERQEATVRDTSIAEDILVGMFYVERDEDGRYYVCAEPGLNPIYLATRR